ncbi:MAG: flagellar biosynthetic protein FliO [Leptospirillia bacterium]
MKKLITLLALVIAVGCGTAQAASPVLAGKSYLDTVKVNRGAGALTLSLKVRGEADYSIAYLKNALQITLHDAYLYPSKQHIPVNHPGVKEVFAYQFDPSTVRVRLITDGIEVSTLKGEVVDQPVRDGLRLTVSGLPAQPVAKAALKAGSAVAKVAPKKQSKPAPRPAPVVLVKAEKPTSVAAAREDDAVPSVDRASARQAALVELDRILATTAPAKAAELHASSPAEPAPDPTPDQGKGKVAPGGERTSPKIPEPADRGAGEPALVAGPPHLMRVASAGSMPHDGVTGAGTSEAVAPQGGGAPGDADAQNAAEVSDAGPDHTTSTASVGPVDTQMKLTPLKVRGSGSSAPSLTTSTAKMAGGLILILGLMYGGARLLKHYRVGGLNPRAPMRVISSMSVGSRQSIVVVEVEGRRLVVGVGPGGMELLANLTESNAGAPADGGGAGTDSGSKSVLDDILKAPSAPDKQPPDSPFAKALLEADRGGSGGRVSQTTKRLEERIRLLKARSA